MSMSVPADAPEPCDAWYEAVRNCGVNRSYTIAFSVRSGSNEICNLLARNGMGSPAEHFQSMESFKREQSALHNLLDIVSRHVREGIFGSKMAHDHRARIDSLLRIEIPNYVTIADVFPDHKWVWLIRRDKIAQAISLCRAEQSGVWATPSLDLKEGRQLYEFDFYYILSRVMMLSASDIAWATYFDTHKIHPYKIYYEEFFHDIDRQLFDLSAYLGGRPSSCNSSTLHNVPTLCIQRDELSLDWYKRFALMLNRVGELGEPSNAIRQNWERFFFGRGWLSRTSPEEPPQQS